VTLTIFLDDHRRRIAIASGVCVAFFQELRAEFRHSAGDPGTASHPSFGWFDLAAGVLLMLKRSTHARNRCVPSPHLRLPRSPPLHQIGPLRRLTLRWAELASIDLSETKVVFHWTDGRRHSIRLSWFRNADAARRAVADHPAAAALLVESALRLYS
jgi:hypothetical protein